MRANLLFAALAGAVLFHGAGAEEGVTASSILIGQSTALSGPSAQLGKELRDGALAYFEQINRRGGIHGRKILLESLDDGFQAERATANYRQLIEQRGVFALFGCVGGATCAAALPVISKAQVPFVGPANGNEVLRIPFNRYMFNVRASFADEVEHVIDHLVTVGVVRVAVFHPDDVPGRAALATAKAALARRNLALAAAGSYPREATDVKAGVAAIAPADPQAVVIFGPYKVSARFISELKKSGREPQFMALSVAGAQALASELGESGRGVGISQVVPYPWVTTQPILREYNEIYVVGGKGTPSFTSLEGFIAAKVLAEGLRRAGPQPSREKFIAAMESLRQYDVGGMTIDYSPTNRAGSRYVELTVIGKDRKILR